MSSGNNQFCDWSRFDRDKDLDDNGIAIRIGRFGLNYFLDAFQFHTVRENDAPFTIDQSGRDNMDRDGISRRLGGSNLICIHVLHYNTCRKFVKHHQKFLRNHQEGTSHHFQPDA